MPDWLRRLLHRAPLKKRAIVIRLDVPLKVIRTLREQLDARIGNSADNPYPRTPPVPVRCPVCRTESFGFARCPQCGAALGPRGR